MIETLIACLVALAVGVTLGYAWRAARGGTDDRAAAARNASLRDQVAALQADLAAASARAELLEKENNEYLERARENNSVLRQLAPIADSLEKMDARVADLGRQQAAQSSALGTRLQRATEVQDALARETTSLRGALTSRSARGLWGEAELRRIVEAAGMLEHVDFDTQEVDRTSGARPDLVVHLPGNAHLAVDAKVPLDALLRAQQEDGTDAASLKRHTAYIQEHAKAVRAHVKALASRNYPALFPGSPQFTVMYLPSDSLLAEALRADGTLLDYSYTSQIVPVGPSSLLALLRAVAAVWSSAAVTEEAQQILALGHELADRLSTAVSHLDTLGGSLRRAVDAYNRTVGSLESRVLVTARKLQSLDVTMTPPQAISADSAQVRQFSAPEFTESERNSRE